MRNSGLNEAQAGTKIARRNINNLRYADDTTLMAESEEELKSLLMKVKEGEWKSWLKTQHSENEDQWHPVPSLHGKQVGKKCKHWQTIFLGSKVTVMVTAAMKLKDACS